MCGFPHYLPHSRQSSTLRFATVGSEENAVAEDAIDKGTLQLAFLIFPLADRPPVDLSACGFAG